MQRVKLSQNKIALHHVHVVLPAFNEEMSLPSLLGQLERLAAAYDHPLTVWVVDDGSCDHTAKVARAAYGNLDVRLISHPVNFGLGQAVRSGLMAVLDQAGDADAVVVMDADDTHDVAILPRLVAQIEAGADIAIASRFVPGGSDHTAPWLRRGLSRLAAVTFKTLFPMGICDFTSGYRAYRVRLLGCAVSHYGERLVEERGFAVMVELLLKLRPYHPVVAEVPMVLRYDLKRSPSKLKVWRTIAQYLELVVRSRLTPPF
jgi:dolichol-phosphate mannosyltransferase